MLFSNHMGLFLVHTNVFASHLGRQGQQTAFLNRMILKKNIEAFFLLSFPNCQQDYKKMEEIELIF